MYIFWVFRFRHSCYRHTMPSSNRQGRYTPHTISTLGGGDHAPTASSPTSPSQRNSVALYSGNKSTPTPPCGSPTTSIEIPPGSYITFPSNMPNMSQMSSISAFTKGQAISPPAQKSSKGATTSVSPRNRATSPSKVLVYRIFSRYWCCHPVVKLCIVPSGGLFWNL